MANGDDGLIVIDTSALAELKKTGELVVEKPINRLRLDGAQLLVGNDADGLLVVDISAPDSPKQVFPLPNS